MHDYSGPLSLGRRRFLRSTLSAGVGLIGASSSAFSSVGRSTEEAARTVGADRVASPEWTKGLIIYEIGSTHAFTSPKGPGTGTFGSMTDKLPYLQELGINGIWMDPPSLQDSRRFFYNIWCRYAVVDPGKFDPSLGTEEQYTKFIDEAHRLGIRIFPDVKTHGLMRYSPIIKQHPDWVRGSHWHMADYDWYGGHTELDDWWVQVWTDCITKYKVDGYRLDVNIFRPDLWKKIRQNAHREHPIIIFEENNTALPGVTDFSQHENAIYAYDSTVKNEVFVWDIPGFYERKFGRVGDYQVTIQYEDGSRVEGSTNGGHGSLPVHLDGLTVDKAPRRYQDSSWYMLDGISDVQLTVENVSTKAIENIIVRDDVLGPWHLSCGGGRLLALEGKPPSLKLYLATVAHGWPTLQLSCHDQGWEGFPLNMNPYSAQGSRALFGYSCLFVPAIPIFVSGEEFNATFRPLPWQSPYLYSRKDAGKGRWLYGCMLDWRELDAPEHQGMLEDVKKMIAIRKRETEILSVEPANVKPKLMAVPFRSGFRVPRPYIRWNDGGAILVAANRDEERDARLWLHMPLAEIGLSGRGRYTVTDLWPGGEGKAYLESDLAKFECIVRRDNIPGGGLRVLKIEPAS